MITARRAGAGRGTVGIMHVLLLGLAPVITDEDQATLERPGLELHVAATLDELRAAFARAKIEHVIMGGGLPLDTRLAAVRAALELSDAVKVHMKDRASGPHGYVPFIRTLLDAFVTAGNS